ncbi:glycosyl hydrolase-related protein [Oleiharenicola lentus]|uniref:glycoside hydrolase family 38 N-terminal domain-containing protein n=1 Tax=Oleiharenicola lentus TaxID=2508720 RepID=UPI003F67B297
MRRFFILSIALGLFATALRAQAQAQSASPADAYWRIEVSPLNPHPFARASASTLVYDVDGPPAARQWRQDQVAANTNASIYTVRFNLSEVPVHAPVLAAEIFFTSMAPGTVVVTVNGTAGRFRIKPAIGTAKNYEQANATTFSAQSLRAILPPELLRAGRNEIGIAYTDIPEKVKGEITAVESRLGTVSYESLALLRGAADVTATPAVASVEPSIFFKRQAGGLVELTEVVVRYARPFSRGQVKLTVGGATVGSVARAASASFGEERFELAVPAVDGVTPYELELDLDGRVQTLRGEFRPAKRWSLFATLQNHSDIGYTDYQPGVQELHNRNVDDVLRVLDEHPEHKFVLESTWLAENFINSRTPEQGKKLMEHARNGRLEVSPFYLNLLTGLSTGEELYRALYPAAKLRRDYGLPMRAATMTDVPSHSWFLPGLLGDAGIQSLSIGSNQHRGQILMGSDLAETSPFYWQGADGRRVLVWYTRVYGQLLRLVGDRGTPERLQRSLPQFMARFLREDYPLDSLLLYGLYGDNMDVREGEVALFEEWNRTFAYPRIIPATHADYFEHVRKTAKHEIPVQRGDGGAYWEDGAGSSAAETIRNRDSQRLLPVAEMVSSFATAFMPGQNYPHEQFRAAWRDVLFYDEHTWGANRSITQPDRDIVRGQWDFKQAFAQRGHLASRALWLGGMDRLARQISVQGQTLIVFNADARTRSGVIETDLDPGVSLVDPASGQAVAMTIVARQEGFDTIRFIAQDVPGIGYRTYTLKRGKVEEPPASQTSWEIKSRHYRVKLDPASGAIVELEDLALGKQLVDAASPYGLNRLVYVSGGEGSRVVNNNTSPEAVLRRDPASHAVLVRNTGDSITVRASAPNVPVIETTITVYNELKRVDIVNRVVKTETRDKEAVYFAFPFRANPPALAYESQAGWIQPNRDQLPGAAREWFATQNVVVARGDAIAIAWASPDAPLCTLTEINRGLWLTDLPVKNAHVYSYVMNNYWVTNYKASQGGEMTFRYAITSAATMDEVAASRFSADTRSPLLPFQYVNAGSNRVQATTRAMPVGRGAFLEIDPAHVQVSAFKQAEDGDGYILRLREVAGRSGTVRLSSPVFALKAVRQTNAVEDNEAALAVEGGRTAMLPVAAYRYVTFRLNFDAAASPPTKAPAPAKTKK